MNLQVVGNKLAYNQLCSVLDRPHQHRFFYASGHTGSGHSSCRSTQFINFFYLSSRKVKRAAYELGWRSSSDFGRDIYDCGIAQLNVYSLEYTATILHTSINKLTPLPRCWQPIGGYVLSWRSDRIVLMNLGDTSGTIKNVHRSVCTQS